MPKNNLTTPDTTAPVDRLSLATAWARPSAAGIEPATPSGLVCAGYFCFAAED